MSEKEGLEQRHGSWLGSGNGRMRDCRRQAFKVGEKAVLR